MHLRDLGLKHHFTINLRWTENQKFLLIYGLLEMEKTLHTIN
jgi:hypothetical protein